MAMGKHSISKTNDPTGLHSSSIALLQERFRQLQRIKEIREERELLRMFADAPAQHPHPHPSSKGDRCEQHSKWFAHPDLVQPSRPLHAPPSSLRVHSHTHQSGTGDFHDSRTLLSIGLWPEQTNVKIRTPKISEDMDVDTSLHL